MEQQGSTQIWAKLIPLSKGLQTYPLKGNETMIGRINCKIIIQQKRLSGKHCVIQKQGNRTYLTDLSTNGTFLNTKKIGKNNRVQLNDGDQIWLLPISKVRQQQTIGFRLSYLSEEMMRQNEKAEEAQKLINSLKEQITCPFCYHIMIYPVTVQPCNHRFCGPCLTELVSKKKGMCIACRKELISAVRDASFNSIIDDYLRSHPEQKRNDEDEQPNIFGYTPTSIRSIIYDDQEPFNPPPIKKVSISRPPQRQKRMFEEQNQYKKQDLPNPPPKVQQNKSKRKPKKIKGFICSDISASTDSETDLKKTELCKQCLQERNGFLCSATQKHVNCHNCSKIFAIRDDVKLNQTCILCKSYFCNLYMPPCQRNGPKLILLGKRAETCKIEPIVFRSNKVQMDAFKNLLISEKKNLFDMFKDMLALAESGRFMFMFDRRLLRSPPTEERAVRLDKRSAVCDNCWRELWFQMIFSFVKEHAYLMPDSIKNRPPCYWGINCRTMEHNLEHAKRYNHMEYQTKF